MKRIPLTRANRPLVRMRIERLEDRLALAANVVISEIFYQPPGNATNERQYEWVEVYNAGNMDANLRGWVLSAIASGGVTENVLYSRPNTVAGNFILPPGNYAIIAANINRHPTIPPAKKIGNTTNWSGAGASLDNAGGSVILRDNSTGQNRLVARVDYFDQDPWPVFADGYGPSLRIIDPTRPFIGVDISDSRYHPTNWTSSIERGGSPAAPGLTVGPGVVFNEVLSSSNNAIQELDRIELYNTTDATVDLSGWFITDNDNTAEGTATAAELEQYVFPTGTTIGPHGYVTIDESQFGAGANGFRVNGTVGDRLLLINATVPAGTPALYSDMVEFEPSEESVSFGRVPNGEGPMLQTESQTFGHENSGHKLSDLVISEVMYQPPSDNLLLEYVELLNRGTTTVNLFAPPTGTAGWRLRANIDFDFPPGTTVAPGERVTIVPFNPTTDAANRVRFENTYRVMLNSGTGRVVKAIGGHVDDLENDEGVLELQERVLVGVNDLGQPVYDFIQRENLNYRDSGDWPRRADGFGASLERIDFDLLAGDPDAWNGSREYNGTPGYSPDSAKTVLINEVLAHTDPPYYDSIELYNPTSQPVDIGNWWVAQDVSLPELALRFEIPAGTILPPGAYITFNNDPDPTRPHFNFGLDAAEGGNLYLLQTQNSQIIRFADNISYPPSFNGVTMGRWPNGGGHHRIVPLTANTLADAGEAAPPAQTYFDGANWNPRIGDVVIDEIMYNAGPIEGAHSLEYVELFNRTSQPIDLGALTEPDSASWPNPPQGWRLDKAVDFEFRTGHIIPPLSSLLVVGFDPATDPARLAALRSYYAIHPNVPIVGPFTGRPHLPDFGGNVQLLAPDFALPTLPPNQRFTPLVLADEVRYDDDGPWPTRANGVGCALKRVSPDAFGNDPASWVAARSSPQFAYPSVGPRVRRVALSGDGWDPTFGRHVAPPCEDLPGYELPAGAAQTKAIPWTDVAQIAITFDEAVAIFPGALTVSGDSGVPYTVAPAFTYDGLTHTATWTVSPAIRGQVSIRLDATRVRDMDLSPLDGEWTDGLSAFPSGDGLVGGDFSIRFNVVTGDANRDGQVSTADFHRVRAALFSRSTAAGFQTASDIDGSGKITIRDWVLTRNALPASAQPMANRAIILSTGLHSPPSDSPVALNKPRLTATKRQTSPPPAIADQVLADWRSPQTSATTHSLRSSGRAP